MTTRPLPSTDDIDRAVTDVLDAEADVEAIEAQRRMRGEISLIHDESPPVADDPEALAQVAAARQPGAVFRPPPAVEDSAPAPFVRDTRKIGRNEPCPCGSGKKFKQCHGRVA